MPAPTGLGRQPAQEMSADDALDLVRLLEEAGVAAWPDGGWAVDAVLGTQTRPHDDLGLVRELADTGYEPHLSSYDDVRAPCRRFGLPVPTG